MSLSSFKGFNLISEIIIKGDFIFELKFITSDLKKNKHLRFNDSGNNVFSKKILEVEGFIKTNEFNKSPSLILIYSMGGRWVRFALDSP